MKAKVGFHPPAATSSSSQQTPLSTISSRVSFGSINLLPFVVGGKALSRVEKGTSHFVSYACKHCGQENTLHLNRAIDSYEAVEIVLPRSIYFIAPADIWKPRRTVNNRYVYNGPESLWYRKHIACSKRWKWIEYSWYLVIWNEENDECNTNSAQTCSQSWNNTLGSSFPSDCTLVYGIIWYHIPRLVRKS